ncbi:hypothetical protein BDY19DRAFT_732428 [Irpex rosettiformis]|uniref:Uncharacterized protein n=1 Tax=Irpex rosettiformis TaxID=378272 RepID=A0ACB8U927_9APHY|nr:hypothetical protein BDY19DRAFT_732428 [Irpex rosettiformis]
MKGDGLHGYMARGRCMRGGVPRRSKRSGMPESAAAFRNVFCTLTPLISRTANRGMLSPSLLIQMPSQTTPLSFIRHPPSPGKPSHDPQIVKNYDYQKTKDDELQAAQEAGTSSSTSSGKDRECRSYREDSRYNQPTTREMGFTYDGRCIGAARKRERGTRRRGTRIIR